MSLNAGTVHYLGFSVGATELAAGTPIRLIAPADGYITEAGLVVQAATTGAEDVAFHANLVEIAGLSITVPTASAAGTLFSKTPTVGTATRRILKGQELAIVPGAAFTAGAVNGYLKLSSADTAPALPAQSPA